MNRTYYTYQTNNRFLTYRFTADSTGLCPGIPDFAQEIFVTLAAPQVRWPGDVLLPGPEAAVVVPFPGELVPVTRRKTQGRRSKAGFRATGRFPARV
jgi:hypothetical protein